ETGEVYKVKMTFIFIDGLINKEYVSEYAIQSVISQEELKSFSLEGFKSSLIDVIAKEALATVDVAEENLIDNLVNRILSGDTVILIDTSDKALVMDTKGWDTRGVDEPETEAVVRGPRDGFTETAKINMTLVRRRIKDPKLKMKMEEIGVRSKTTLVIMYIEDIVDKSLLDKVYERLDNIDIDAVIDSSVLENLLED